jgi:hypothetical protein
VRTTIDIPEDLHRQALAIARDTSRTLSETVSDLVRRGLEGGPASKVLISRETGLPHIRVGKIITTEDVRGLEDQDSE